MSLADASTIEPVRTPRNAVNANELTASSLSQFNPLNDCLLATGQVGLIASGRSQSIRLPVTDENGSQESFHSAVKEALSAARAAGQLSPVVVGAIPFDTRKPSHLFVPKSHRFLPASDFQALQGGQQEVSLVDATSAPDERGYRDAVTALVRQFEAGELQKSVLSRRLDMVLSAPVDPVKLMGAIVQQNPASHYFSVPLEDGSIFMGASPELLVRRHGMELQANPLAGSIARESDPSKDCLVSERLLTSEKDLREHRLVVDDIKRNLAPYCVSLDVPATPSLVSTPAMWHLSTRLQGWLKNPEVTSLTLACALHPTPAVCGFPTKEAKEALLSLENYDRHLFTGIVGWCDANGNGDWAIAIRCGQVQQQSIQLFAGAGIVLGSQPEKEWLETQAKLATMLRAMGLSGNARL